MSLWKLRAKKLEVRKVRLILQYDGTDYSGWQTQKKERTIQGIIEDAIYSVTGERTRVTGAARTDAGVHALEQVAAFRTGSDLEPQIFLRALNANLPFDIRVINAQECPADFHPRYSAKSKTYSYIISPANTFSPSPLPPPLVEAVLRGDPLREGEGGGRGNFYSPLSSSVYRNVSYSVFIRRYSWQIPYKLDCKAMKKAAEYLIGKHDFACFRGSGCSSKNPVRTVHKIEISELSSMGFMSFTFDVPVIKISIQADAFLRYMARNIVGTLVEVGRGKILPLRIKEILELGKRIFAGPTAPASGLFLERINY